MTFLDAFKAMDQVKPFASDSYDPQSHEPQFHDTTKMSEQYNLYNVQMPRYAFDGYISPYPSNNWDMSSNILNYVEDESRFPALEPKIDPNRIFTADIAALRALAADQNKVIRMFEKRFQETMADKSKFGLTEDDIEALQALTSARTAMMNITKAQVDIRKNIADLKIKQAQQQKVPGLPGADPTQSASSLDVGKSLMDRIFDLPTASVSTAAFNPAASGTDVASTVLDTLVPTIDVSIQHEVQEPTTYVVVGDDDTDVEFVTYGSNGEIIPDYPVPTSTIDKIDRDADVATDSRLVQYPIKYRNK